MTELTHDDPAKAAVELGLVGAHSEEVFFDVGAWRWPILHDQAERIVELLTKGYAIDYGGAAAPVGYGAVVVDYQGPHGAPRSLIDVPPNADCVFCSHTLEHFVDLFGALASITAKLKIGGHLIIQVPSWARENLRAENWQYHEQTFRLEHEENGVGIPLDRVLRDWGYELEYVSHKLDSQHILIIAKRAKKVLI